MSLLNSTGRALLLTVFIAALVGCSDATKQENKDNAGQSEQSTTELKSQQQKGSDSVKSGPATLEVKDKTDSKLTAMADNCESLSQEACLNSAKCVVEQGKEKNYYCRAAENACEMGFIQKEGMSRNTCLAEKGCTLVPASCYCPPGVQCVCGGGAPPACKMAKKGGPAM